MAADESRLVESVAKLDLQESSLEDLQLARVVTRKATQLVFWGYNSDQDDSDGDESDGDLVTEREFHENGNPRHFRTFKRIQPSGLNEKQSEWERIVEEKHFDVDGVCRLDIHFALEQPYLYRKHFFENQRLKSEQVFWVEDERTMVCKKIGWWRTYYENGNVQSEIQYNDKGIRIGFAKRYGRDGTILWIKDYTKEYQSKLRDFNDKKGQLQFSEADAATLLGFEGIPKNMADVNSRYRILCAPLHPDKKPDPEATEKFIQLSRARDVLKEYFQLILNGEE